MGEADAVTFSECSLRVLIINSLYTRTGFTNSANYELSVNVTPSYAVSYAQSLIFRPIDLDAGGEFQLIPEWKKSLSWKKVRVC